MIGLLFVLEDIFFVGFVGLVALVVFSVAFVVVGLIVVVVVAFVVVGFIVVLVSVVLDFVDVGASVVVPALIVVSETFY